MVKDYYITVLKLLNESRDTLTNEELAHVIADEIRKLVEVEISNFLK